MRANTHGNLLSRRSALALGGAGLATAGFGLGAKAQGLADFPVQLNWLETADFAGPFAAEKEGYDADEGIRQVFIPGGPQVDPIQSVAGGTGIVGIAGSVGQVALARASGIPVKLLGALYRNSPVGLISLADTPILTPQDAVGKKIGLQGGARLTWSIILKENGLTEDQMTIVPVAADITPLVSRQVDAYWGTAVNQHIALKMRGIDNTIMTRASTGAPEHFEVIFTMERSIRRHGDEIVKWLKAVRKGQEYAAANPAALAEHIVSRSPALQLDPEQQKMQVEGGLGFVNPPGKDLPFLRIDEEGAAIAIAQMDGMGILPSPVMLDDILDTSLLDQAYA